MLTLRFLGPVGITINGENIHVGRKSTALIAFLGIRGPSGANRETLCALLWPEATEQQARSSLRQALSGIRKSFGPAADRLEASADTVRLNQDQIYSDLTEFFSKVDATDIEDLQKLVELYRGDFLEGLGAVTPEFDRWLDAERGALRSRAMAALLRLADLNAENRRYEEMIATGQRLLQFDPLQEHVHRRIMRVYHAQGRHDAALKQFSNLTEVLTRELGVEPETLSKEIAQKIRKDRRQPVDGTSQSSKTAGPPLSLGVQAPTRPSIAVLKFQGWPKESEAEFLGDGICEDVTVELSRVPDVLVVSRQSAFRINEESLSAQEIGAQLGVRFYLSGTVRVSGNKLRVAAHLVSCHTGHELWAERFDRELMDVFDIQSEIARTVSATAADRMAASLITKVADNRPDSLESYELVLKGIAAVHRFSKEGYVEAEKLFELAVEQSPGYGRAYGWLAMARLYHRWNIDASIELSDVVTAAERSISLDPTEAKGHLARGMSLFINRQFDEAEFRFQAALKSNPNDELVLIEYGRFLMYLDQPEAGLQRIREGMRVNPFFPDWFWSIQGRCLHTLGRYKEAVLAFERVQSPPFYIHAYRAACYAKLENPDRMVSARSALYAARPDFDLENFKKIFPYKNKATAERLFDSFEIAGLS